MRVCYCDTKDTIVIIFTQLHLVWNCAKFENFEKQMKVPFVVYADIESILKPIDTCESNPGKSYTCKTFIHEPFSFAYLIKYSFDDSLSKFVFYRGNNASKIFVERLESDLTEIYNNFLKNIVPMTPLSEEEQKDFDNAKICAICEKPFEMWQPKIKDHCHLTGKKRCGATHSVCNLNYKIPNFIPIILHNFSGYDAHLFVRELCSK
uniref:DNA-directed DNA polymerase n=1 Tax=Anoplophora glabripennis TaxID=217634 RepID=V5GJ86_ANOGL